MAVKERTFFQRGGNRRSANIGANRRRFKRRSDRSRRASSHCTASKPAARRSPHAAVPPWRRCLSHHSQGSSTIMAEPGRHHPTPRSNGEPGRRRRRSARSPNMSRICRSRIRTRRRSSSGRSQPQLDVQFNIGVDARRRGRPRSRAQDRGHGQVATGHALPRRPDLRRPVRLRNIPDEALRALPAGRRRRACCSRSPARSSPTRSQNAGFPPLLLDPIDFAGAYMEQVEQQQRRPTATGGRRGEPPPSDA